MRRITYRGSGTGLRLDGEDGSVLDVSGSHAPGAPMGLYVGRLDTGTTIMLEPGEVVLLIEECAHYLARFHRVPGEEERR